MSSDFVTNDIPFNDEEIIEENSQTPVIKENVKGVLVSGWVLAFLLPFVGVIINVWLVRNAKNYSYNKMVAFGALIISVITSFALLLLIFALLFNFYNA